MEDVADLDPAFAKLAMRRLDVGDDEVGVPVRARLGLRHSRAERDRTI